MSLLLLKTFPWPTNSLTLKADFTMVSFIWPVTSLVSSAPFTPFILGCRHSESSLLHQPFNHKSKAFVSAVSMDWNVLHQIPQYFLSGLYSHGTFIRDTFPDHFFLKYQVPSSLITLTCNFFTLSYFKAFNNILKKIFNIHFGTAYFGTRHSSKIFINIHSFSFHNISGIYIL